MDRRKFITTCACCACAGGAAVFLNKYNNQKPNNFLVDSIEIHITEHCNLKCKYCTHFSCIAEEEFYDLNKFEQDIKQMSRVFDKKLFYLQLYGGEPLLNPQINEYVKISRKYFPETHIAILTNATLLDDMKESFWKTLNENNVYIKVSVYPIEINWKSILDKAKKYDVEICNNISHEEKLTLDNIEKYKITSFGKMNLKQEGSGDITHQLRCKERYTRYVMQDGKIYFCTTIAFVRHLNKKFNTNFIVTKDDYLDLYKMKNTNEIKEFTKKPLFHFCKYCGTGKELKWEHSPVHDISEWT